ncbi:DUF544-domain-containing protein [Clavulina sp. PMI_390]|nr:DUF544-domain-containing protein [Clavulina sp. PMI_390]
MATTTNHETRTAASASASAVWPLKEIIYPPHSDRRIKIVYQRRNGPCSLLAICNILILRGDVEIQPPGRKTASYEYLSSLVADFLVTKHGGSAAGNEGDLTSALAVLPSTQEGMDLNPLFTGMSSFRPEGSGGELQLFELCNILLVHGWLVDPQSPEYDIVAKAQDYDTALNMIVAGEEASEAQISTKAPDDAIGSSPPAPDEDTHLRDGLVLRQFLEQNPTQLTFHGLWSLFSLSDGLYAFIRNSHLSVLYKCQNPQLWMLVTDSNLVPEPSIVWESIEDVDGADSRFVDSHFFPSSTIGGDYSGYIPADTRPPPPTSEYENE